MIVNKNMPIRLYSEFCPFTTWRILSFRISWMVRTHLETDVNSGDYIENVLYCMVNKLEGWYVFTSVKITVESKFLPIVIFTDQRTVIPPSCDINIKELQFQQNECHTAIQTRIINAIRPQLLVSLRLDRPKAIHQN